MRRREGSTLAMTRRMTNGTGCWWIRGCTNARVRPVRCGCVHLLHVESCIVHRAWCVNERRITDGETVRQEEFGRYGRGVFVVPLPHNKKIHRLPFPHVCCVTLDEPSPRRGFRPASCKYEPSPSCCQARQIARPTRSRCRRKMAKGKVGDSAARGSGSCGSRRTIDSGCRAYPQVYQLLIIRIIL